jgi:hypothetical protein
MSGTVNCRSVIQTGVNHQDDDTWTAHLFCSNLSEREHAMSLADYFAEAVADYMTRGHKPFGAKSFNIIPDA